MTLVKQESKKKLAPLPPPGTAKNRNGPSTFMLKDSGYGSEKPSNPFDDDDNEGVEAESAEVSVPSSVAVVHPWYGISQTTEESTEAGTPSGKASPAYSESPGSIRSKKRVAPKAPKSSSSGQ